MATPIPKAAQDASYERGPCFPALESSFRVKYSY